MKLARVAIIKSQKVLHVPNFIELRFLKIAPLHPRSDSHLRISVADPDYSDTDPDPVFHFDTDPDPYFHLGTDPDPCLFSP